MHICINPEVCAREIITYTLSHLVLPAIIYWKCLD